MLSSQETDFEVIRELSTGKGNWMRKDANADTQKGSIRLCDDYQ